MTIESKPSILNGFALLIIVYVQSCDQALINLKLQSITLWKKKSTWNVDLKQSLIIFLSREPFFNYTFDSICAEKTFYDVNSINHGMKI